MGNRGHLIVAFVAILWACGGGGGATPWPDMGGRDEGLAPDRVVADRGQEETLSDAAPDDGFGDGEAIQDPGRDPDPGHDVPLQCPGANGCPCVDNGDCYSGICVETMEGWVCAAQCVDETSCPAGWKCLAIGGTGGDVIYGCVDPFARLCRPCRNDAECVPDVGAVPGAKYVCIEYGPEGRFCGAACAGPSDCPAGFSCEETTAGRETVKQCVTLGGAECPCTQKYKDQGALTGCYVVNDFGKCLGERTCDSECSAPTPAAEACNDRDDDCDGQTDEEVPPVPCPLENEHGTCQGQTRCIGGQEVCEGSYASPEVCNGGDDNCDGVTDEGYPDMDEDLVADCVDPDQDGDGVVNAEDNCLDTYNPDQANCEADAMGDACDPDDDNDGVADEGDNCLCAKNADQKNTDGDEQGDACEGDDDNDDVADGEDNCPLQANTLQEDMNEDGEGDACDCDRDGDGVSNPGVDAAGEACPACDPCDNCPGIHNPEQTDLNENGIGDDCEHDWDGDGLWNEDDNCPWVANPLQEDLDVDAEGDACDCDMDADGFSNENPDCPEPDPADNCPMVANPGQEDLDVDDVGDACDPDRDGDGDPNDTDCAPDDPAISHNAVEGCNGVDDDCDGDTDEAGALGCAVYHRDEDGDGFGTAENQCLCAAVAPFTAVLSGDCDDADAAVNPDATEYCNNNDDDCDGATDEEGAADCTTYYRDLDRDGYGATEEFKCLCAPIVNSYDTTLSGDCVDTDEDIHPGAPELCNNKDDDCEGGTDEEFPLKGQACDGPDGDQCKEGVWTCDLLQTGVVCTDNTDTNIETCNGADDDCDGLTDEKDANGCTDFYYDGDRDGWGTSLSQCLCQGAGNYTAAKTGDCDDTDGAVFPGAPEKCNGVNDDCDGQTDEDFPLKGQACDGADGDLCEEGTYVCNAAGDGVECTDAMETNPETCNGQDDDCDGQTDEDFPLKGQPCDGMDGDLCKEGTYVCNALGTGLDCTDQTGTTVELCNDQDDDCDGQTDEDFPLKGQACDGADGDDCKEGVWQCGGGALVCSDVTGTNLDVCNEQDDDCDGLTDEDFSQKGQACDGPDEDQCKEGVFVCNAQGTGLDCNDATGTNVESCNNVDDDCDGGTDEDFPQKGQACDGADTDLCKEGNWVCNQAGTGLDCGDNTGNNAELCNNQDDDCDAVTDEDFPEKGQSCDGGDDDSCKEGTFVCNANGSGLDCNDNTGTNVELCNNQDDDCDGTTDEDFPQKGQPCDGADGDLCKEGIYFCNAQGTGLDCNDYTNTNTEACDGEDDDCDGQTDEDDPLDMCGTVAHGSPQCAAGACVAVCDAGWYDVDHLFATGCECQQDGNDHTGNSCGAAVDIGSGNDASPGQVLKTQSGRVVPDNDVDWYKFTFTDTADTGTFAGPGHDKYKLRVRLTTPTDGSIRVNVYRGGCEADKLSCQSGSTAAIDYQFYTNYSDTANRRGEDPCVTSFTPVWGCCRSGECQAGGNPTECCGGKNNNNPTQCTGTYNVRTCQDTTATYYIKVYRASGSAASCNNTEYTFEISN